MWDGNILSQQLGINNNELVGAMILLVEGLRAGAFTHAEAGVTFVPMVDYANSNQYGGRNVHHQFLLELLGSIADGTSPFSQGVARAAEQLGHRAVEIYDAAYPAYGYRNHHIEGAASALHWATDTRDPFNSCHDYTSTFGWREDVAAHFGLPGGQFVPVRRMVYQAAQRSTVWVQHHQCVKNSLPICEYASMPDLFFHPPEMAVRIFESRLLSAVTGVDYGVGKLWRAGDRIWNLRRAIMVLREDRERADDTLKDIWFEQVVGSGDEVLPEPLDRVEWEALKDRYYALRGWDVSSGRPTRANLEELDLGDVADTLEAAGKLGG
jgi:aldehyde:ferredoxin oxidoreductase